MGKKPNTVVEPTSGFVADRAGARVVTLRAVTPLWRKATLRVAHLVVGLLFLVGFLLSGQYMHFSLGHLQDTPATERMLYRSTHIYLLWSALLNVALGIYLRRSVMPVRRTLQCIGSLLILSGPILLAVAFFHEPSLPELQRPLSRPAIYSAFGGLLLHLLASTPWAANEPNG